MSEPIFTTERVTKYAGLLRSYATHFQMRDWDYTPGRGEGRNRLVHIRYEGDFSGYDHPWKRLGRTLKQFNPWHDDCFVRSGIWSRWHAWQHPWITLKVNMGTNRHLPDGYLDGGGVLTFWEETGEYINMVQPSVGEMLADLMDAHPELPEVQRIADEMKRIWDRYTRDATGGES